MGEVIGFDITPNSGSSLRKMLKLELTSYMGRLEAISVAATREHALELMLKEMKAEWADVHFVTVPYRYKCFLMPLYRSTLNPNRVFTKKILHKSS